ncbi:hypothetical protein [Xanthomonas axonopodis]|uniref:hypothetical protein n=1 Tax=Xanthomonas axonopodis TaxID=53413 RepID=UPI0011160A51|nr:hypothetical protein [Xanthomonas axonopodis]
MKVSRYSFGKFSLIFGLLAGAALPQAYGAEKYAGEQVENIVTLFGRGEYVNQGQVEDLMMGAKTSALIDKSSQRYYRSSFIAPSSQIREVRFGTHQVNGKSQKWVVGSLSAFFSESRADDCETFDHLVKSMGFTEKMREPRASIKGATWTRPAVLSKAPYVIAISTTDLTSPCVSGLTIVEEKNSSEAKH